MSFDVNGKVQKNGITKEQFVNQMAQKNVKAETASNIFDQFNNNEAAQTIGGKEAQVLDENEQVGLMSFFKQLAGGDNKDTKVTRRDFRRNKGDAGAVKGAKYKDYKKAMTAFGELVEANNTPDSNDDADITFQKDKTIVADDGSGVTTKYTLDENKVTNSETSDGLRKEELKYENGKVNEQKVEQKEDNVTTTTVNGKKTKTVEENENSTVTTNFGDNNGVRRTDDKTANTVTVEEFSGESPDAGNITKKTILDNNNKTATVTEGNTTSRYENSVDESNLGKLVETTVKDGNKTVNTNYKNHTRTTENGDNKTLKTEFLAENNDAVKRTVTKSDKKLVFNDGGKDSAFALDKKGNITAYAKYENGKYEKLNQAAQRLGFKEGTDAYKSFIAANGGKTNGYLRAGQALKISADIATSPDFNVKEAKTDRQTQIHNWRAANPEKAALAAAKRQGITNLRKTFAFKDYQVYYDPSGEKKSRVDGQGQTGGTHYIYKSGKLVNLEDYVKSKGMKLANGEHIIRIAEDGTVRTNKNQFYKLDGTKSDVKSYNNSFKAGHKASGGEIRDLKNNSLGKTTVTQETGTPESKQYKALMKSYDNAVKAFEEQNKKDGWAAKAADAIAHLWNNDMVELTGNTSSMVRRDLNAYKEKMSQLKAALDKDDMPTFKRLYDELQKSDIGKRIAKYNKSQDDGATAVKATAIGVASGAAAIATGGASLAVEAAVAGGTAAAARVAVEVTDLASNDVDGDINSQSMKNIAKQAIVDGAVSAATVGAFRGISNAFKPNVAETGLVKAGTSDVAVSTTRTVSQSASAGSRSALDSAIETASAEGKEIFKRMSAQDVNLIKSMSGSTRNWNTPMVERLAKILGIKPSDIGNLSKSQARTLMKALHPDKNGGSQLAHDLFTLISLIE